MSKINCVSGISWYGSFIHCKNWRIFDFLNQLSQELKLILKTKTVEFLTQAKDNQIIYYFFKLSCNYCVQYCPSKT